MNLYTTRSGDVSYCFSVRNLNAVEKDGMQVTLYYSGHSFSLTHDTEDEADKRYRQLLSVWYVETSSRSSMGRLFEVVTLPVRKVPGLTLTAIAFTGATIVVLAAYKFVELVASVFNSL